MSYRTQFYCRSRRGKYADGCKVCEQQFIESFLIVTTQDSRIRQFDIINNCFVAKYRGVNNDKFTIRAMAFNNLLISGSNRNLVYIWELYTPGMSTDNLNNQQQNMRSQVPIRRIDIHEKFDPSIDILQKNCRFNYSCIKFSKSNKITPVIVAFFVPSIILYQCGFTTTEFFHVICTIDSLYLKFFIRNKILKY